MPILNPLVNYRASREFLGLVWRHSQLTWEMTRRELTEKYAGQILGAIWAFVHPAILIGVYVFVFAFVFAMKMSDTGALPLDYTTYLLAGLIPWLTCAEAMSKGTSVLVGNANLVKQVVFPLEVLPVKTVLASFVTQLVMTAILVLYIGLTLHTLPWTVALLPLLFLCQVLGLIGLCCVLSAVGTYFRDLREFVQILNIVGIYLMPVVYVPSMVPEMFQPVLFFNPFSHMAWCYQDACFYGDFAHPWAWVVFPVLCAGTFALGYRVFRKLKPMFGNVL